MEREKVKRRVTDFFRGPRASTSVLLLRALVVCVGLSLVALLGYFITTSGGRGGRVGGGEGAGLFDGAQPDMDFSTAGSVSSLLEEMRLASSNASLLSSEGGAVGGGVGGGGGPSLVSLCHSGVQ